MVSTDDTEKLRTVLDLCARIGVGMLTTRDGSFLRARPMLALIDGEAAEIWLFTRESTHKVEEIDSHPQACLAFADPATSAYVSLSGPVRFTRDAARARELERNGGRLVPRWGGGGRSRISLPLDREGRGLGQRDDHDDHGDRHRLRSEPYRNRRRRHAREAEPAVRETLMAEAGTSDKEIPGAGRRVAILATNGYEQSELLEPLEALRQAGHSVSILSLTTDPIRGVVGHDWADEVEVDRALEDASPEDFDALVLPGGVYNPDRLRQEIAAVEFVSAMMESGKPVAAICHGPWLLAEAELAEGRRMTSYPSIRTDLIHAGAEWVDEPAVVDRNLLTSRSPEDLPRFTEALLALVGAT
ncbi:MAG: DJ-1/PfpI/YhbO family deglycase/protease [Alphaproteobacteria bacterium]|nr:DJ-1/PfpI/YhbO family deglycase/protease [Alphaproteobacteria bacterium]